MFSKFVLKLLLLHIRQALLLRYMMGLPYQVLTLEDFDLFYLRSRWHL
jgi:hypothetical protein